MTKIVKQPSQVRAINTRRAVLEAARKSFFKYGYKKTNTSLIAKEAGTSVGIVYSYFKDKKELLELWLNNLLSRLDEYFYNQFKLLEYEVELSLIISNIMTKLTDNFFASPLAYENDDPYLNKTLKNFYDKAEQIFVKSCYDSEVFVKSQNETAHIILNLIKAYNLDLLTYRNNRDSLKNKYVVAICALITH